MTGPSGRRKVRPKADHAATAQEARDNPGVWVLVAAYGTNSSAVQMGNRIDGTYNDAITPPYEPVGSFESETRMTELATELWVRYNGEPGYQVTDDPQKRRRVEPTPGGARRLYTRHQVVADTARSHPSLWIRVSSHPSRNAARLARTYVKKRYTPVGSFVTDIRMGKTQEELWVKYIEKEKT